MGATTSKEPHPGGSGSRGGVKLVNTNEWSERERRQFENEICTLYELQVG